MVYNIHPIFVHFPIAFFLLYSLLKIVPFDKLVKNVAWRQIQRVVLLAGFLGAMVSNATGELAEHIARASHKTVEVHATFAALSMWMYGLLLAGEALVIINQFLAKKNITLSFVNGILKTFEKILTQKTFSWILALVGVVAIFVTGVIGGAMVYGMSADPLAPIIFKLLGLE